MDWGAFCSIVMQSIQLGVKTVSVFGYGEPLLDKGLEEKIGYCADKGLETWLTTNGSILSMQRSFDLVNAGLKNIRFSVHAVTPYHYERVHTGLKWTETIRNIANFCHINKRVGSPVTTHLTCIPLNGEPISQVVDTWENHMDYIEIWKPHNWGGKKKYRESNPVLATCNRPFSGPIQVQADGDVIPCCFLTNSEIVLGNIYESTLFDILTGERYENLRWMHKTGKFHNVACETCDQRNIEDESPLLYSNRDEKRQVGKTSTTKFNLEERNDLYRGKDKYDADSCGTGGVSCSSCCA